MVGFSVQRRRVAWSLSVTLSLRLAARGASLNQAEAFRVLFDVKSSGC
jgi:hypothetical protein